jgi:acyl carrier protein
MNEVEAAVQSVLAEVLGEALPAAPLQASTPLLGAVPELDSMAVVNILTALEERFGFTIGDDEISGAVFRSFGELCGFVAAKLGS